MSNVFKKLIQKEFGLENYYNYLFQYQEIIYGERANELSQPQKQEVYNHMYDFVVHKDKETLYMMKNRLDNALLLVASIRKFFGVVILSYIISMIILFTAPISNTMLAVGSLGVSVCFFAKLCEYISNKYCFLDVHLFKVYKDILILVIDGKNKGY